MYVHLPGSWYWSSVLLVSFGRHNGGNVVTKQCIFHWIIYAITLSYKVFGMASAVEVRGHFTRSMSSSKTFAEGSSLHDVCAATCWPCLHIFIWFYSLDSTPVLRNWTELNINWKFSFYGRLCIVHSILHVFCFVFCHGLSISFCIENNVALCTLCLMLLFCTWISLMGTNNHLLLICWLYIYLLWVFIWKRWYLEQLLMYKTVH